jgi:Methyltransferase domain
MRSDEFWEYYKTVRPLLDHRADSFAAMFEYLDRFDRPVGIIETGCTRQPGNWGGDGNSTVLFDRYAKTHPGTVVHSVDIDPEATAKCRTVVSNLVTVHTADSVKFLQSIADRRPSDLPFIDLLYLDSYDLNIEDSLPSAMHHMKELIASAPFIRADTLVAVDDCFHAYIGLPGAEGQIRIVRPPKIDGKGRFISEYAHHIGAEKVFEGYQCAWLKMRTV